MLARCGGGGRGWAGTRVGDWARAMVRVVGRESGEMYLGPRAYVMLGRMGSMKDLG